jgi:hypothetical protein
MRQVYILNTIDQQVYEQDKSFQLSHLPASKLLNTIFTFDVLDI